MIWRTVLPALISFVIGCALAFFIFGSTIRSYRRRLKLAQKGTPQNGKPGKIRAFIDKIGTMNLILAFIFVSATVFTTVMVRIFLKTGMIPDTLVTCVFSFLGGECGFMAVIRSFKEKHFDRKNELEDREHFEQKENAGFTDSSNQED